MGTWSWFMNSFCVFMWLPAIFMNSWTFSGVLRHMCIESCHQNCHQQCVVFAGHFYSPGSGGSGLGAQLFAFLARCHRAILSIRDGNGTGETMQRRSSYKERRSKAFISGVVGCGRHATVCIVFQTSKLDFCYVFLCENISFCDFFKDLFAENKSP